MPYFEWCPHHGRRCEARSTYTRPNTTLRQQLPWNKAIHLFVFYPPANPCEELLLFRSSMVLYYYCGKIMAEKHTILQPGILHPNRLIWPFHVGFSQPSPHR